MIISSGYNIAGPEVETALLRHPSVAGMRASSACRTRTAAVRARRSWCCAPAPTGEAAVKDLQEFVKARIAPYKYPRAVHIVAALPRTTTGKLQRFKLRDLHRG